MNTDALMPKQSIACIGECMIELAGQPFHQITQSYGGDTYNTAVYLRRMLPESTQVYYITALGSDPLSKELKQAWSDSGLKTDYVHTVENKVPGLYQISVDSTGERSFTYWRNDSAAKYVFDDRSVSDLVTMLSQFDWVYLSGISLAILTDQGRSKLLDALQQYRQKGGKIVFDSNYRPVLWKDKTQSQSAYKSTIELADIALLTLDDEEQHFGQSSAQGLFDFWDCPEIVVKRGAESCLIQNQQGIAEVGAERVERVVDTTAAGDSFGAGYIAGRISDWQPDESAHLGHQLAAKVIQYPGAIIPMEATQHLTTKVSA